MNEMFKEYLGDGAFAHYDGYQIWLTTSNGIKTTNKIALEPEVLERFLNYVEKLTDFIIKANKEKLQEIK